MKQATGVGLVVMCVAGVSVLAAAQGREPARTPAYDLTHVNPRYVVSRDEVQQWHAAKDALGPALSGNPSWKAFLGIIEARLRDYGAVDIVRNAWTYDRWHTSEWPDTSKWSLAIDGKAVRVASYGANSGSTPSEGVTADLLFYDPAQPPASLAGKIVVFQLTHEDEHTPENRRIYEYPGDYLFLSNPETFPNPRIPRTVNMKVTARAEMREAVSHIAKLTDGKAAGAVFVFDSSHDRLAGLYTFGVPPIHQMPTLYVGRAAGRQLIQDARAGKKATLRLVATVEPTETYQLIAYLPGRDYGTPGDQKIFFTTHTDGPSISQDDGGYGLLSIAQYFSHIPRAERPRTLMFFFDNRHYMPGAERAFAKQNWVDQHPDIWTSIVGVIGMEHLGQMEYTEEGEVFKPTGLVEHSILHATNNQRLIDMAIKAVKDSGLRRVSVAQVDRPGIHGTSQGTWFGLGAVGRRRNLPSFATMGDMGAYWATSARLAQFDVSHFIDQVNTMTQLTGELMLAKLDDVRPAPVSSPSQ